MTTKGDVVKKLGLKNFDYALPQQWVNSCLDRGFDVRPHFVWYYEDSGITGRPYPITEEGVKIACILAATI